MSRSLSPEAARVIAAMNGGPPQWEGTLAQGLDRELASETFGPFDAIANVKDGKYHGLVDFKIEANEPKRSPPADILASAVIRMGAVAEEMEKLAIEVAGPRSDQQNETNPAPSFPHPGLIPHVLRMAHLLNATAADMEATIARVRASL